MWSTPASWLPHLYYVFQLAPSIINTIEETWDADSEARLSAGCVESRLEILMSSVNDSMTEATNMRNLQPPPYNSHIAEDDSAIPLIAYT